MLIAIGPNCPGIYGTITDFFARFRIPDSFIIVLEVEKRSAIEPLVSQVLALLHLTEVCSLSANALVGSSLRNNDG